VDLSDLKLIRFSNAVKYEKEDVDATVHFFEDDKDFDEMRIKAIRTRKNTALILKKRRLCGKMRNE
jgi:hypothetical protein